MFKARVQSNSSIPLLPTSGFLAKTYTDANGVHPGRSVEDHCYIVGEIAKALILRYPEALRGLFPPGSELAAACHDVGKISPTFYEKIRQACTQNIPVALDKNINPSLEISWGGHAGVSEATAKALNVPEFVPEILGMHHGFSPQLTGKTATAEFFGGDLWQQQRVALIEQLKFRLHTEWPTIKDDVQARIVAGLTTVSDWIGSGRHFENPNFSWNKHTIEQALVESGFVTPTYIKNLQFNDIFGFYPHPAQEALIQAVDVPGVYILEAPMGMGKTEAALYAAYRILEKGLASGVYFALPTQLTSNKIHQRFNIFLKAILDTNSPHRRALLLHGNAWMVQTEMGEEGRPGGSWFEQSKRGLLAPFSVGTIDQALMAAMSVKHGFVRAFGLAGKVVILDEVHSYDAYTGTILDALVQILRKMRCTIIILSATLNHNRRAALIPQSGVTQNYPLITASNDETPIREIAVSPPEQVKVFLRSNATDEEALEEAIHRAGLGQQILWLENTVDEAQKIYQIFSARAADFNIKCGLLHSRFTMAHRNSNEASWVKAFGKDGWGQRLSQGRILVGTQVLEQSLDIDADFLISRFAPTDMLFQRLGRLWRHVETPRVSGVKREAWLLSPNAEQAVNNPQETFGNSAYVYAPYVLCRSLEVWEGRTEIYLPDNIRPFIEATYVERKENGKMARWLMELDDGNRSRKGRNQLQNLAYKSLALGGKTLPEEHAQTRYSEMETTSVLLLSEIVENFQAGYTMLRLLDGATLKLPHKRHILDKDEWKILTGQLTEQMVCVNERIAPEPLTMAQAKTLGLGHCFYLGDALMAQDKSLLRVAILKNHKLHSLNGQLLHERFHLYYRQDLGYYKVRMDNQ